MSRLCTKCGKPSEYGHIKGECRSCFAKHNPPKAVKIRDNQERLFSYLDDKKCVDCGEDRSNVLDFDHVRGEKLMNVTEMVNRGYDLADIQNEIDKCDIRCANCHRLRTAKEGGHWRSYLSTDVEPEE